MNSAGQTGRAFPLGATVADGGVNFSLFSRTATGTELLLFGRADDAVPSRVHALDPATSRAYHSRYAGRHRSLADGAADSWQLVSVEARSVVLLVAGDRG